MTHQEMWEEFQQATGIKAEYEAWQFGGDNPNALAKLVLEGVKQGTSSAYVMYQYEQADLPSVNDYSVILNQQNEAVCIIKNTKVSALKYKDISEYHAFKEGEGDKTLAYWRKVHLPFFKQELAKIGVNFDEEMLVVYEEFEKVFE